MISFCTMCINSRYEFGTFIEALAYHNRNINFEVCVCHDDRVNDGSSAYLQKLASKYPFVKIIVNTKQDTIRYLRRLIEWYDMHDNFRADLRDTMRHNLDLYEKDEAQLYDPSHSYLWTSLGHLYNKAASIASGDILIFAPGDYIWACNMTSVEAWIIEYRINGMFYGKFSGLTEPVSNESVDRLQQAMNSGLELSIATIQRQYLRYPCSLQSHYLMDIDNKELISLADPDYQKKMVQICRRVQGQPHRFAGQHHGTHIMTRKVYDIIGGFTEEFYGRAWPDDKMNAHAMRLFWTDRSTMPIEYSFNFIHMSVWGGGALGGDHPESIAQEELIRMEPLINSHPIQGRHYSQTYLHHGYPDAHYTTHINGCLDEEFRVGSVRGREAPMVRLT